MSLKKFLERCDALQGESVAERAALFFIIGTCKVAVFLLAASSKVGRGSKAQVMIEYLILLATLALFTVIFTTGSFFTRFRGSMQDSMTVAMDTMEQPDLPPSTSNTTGVTIPWWEEEIEAGGSSGGSMSPVSYSY